MSTGLIITAVIVALIGAAIWLARKLGAASVEIDNARAILESSRHDDEIETDILRAGDDELRRRLRAARDR